MRVPPKLVRRLVIAPLVVAAEGVLVVPSPLILLLALVASPVFGGWRPLRAAVIVLCGHDPSHGGGPRLPPSG
jgi:hypothetical protein